MSRLPVLLATVLLGVSAEAQLTIAGGVYEDAPALALRQHFTPVAGATAKLYLDGGDRTPTADDAALATATTNAAGVYSFRVGQAGDYWVAIDSRTIRAGHGWAEQTFGPSGALCAHSDGTARATYFEGPCVGGRTSASDDAAALTTAEHVAGVTLRDTATAVDFAFSFNAVTSTRDGEGIQGSLRQFILNANVIAGPARMRFVPLERAPEQRQTIMGVPPRWWSITMGRPLPEITGDDTVIDGTAYSILSPATVVNVHTGRLGEPPTIRAEQRQITNLEKPELEIVTTGDAGLACAAACTIRMLAIHGAAVLLDLGADARIEHVMVGAAPDDYFVTGGTTGIRVNRGTTIARHVLVTSQSIAGIHVAADGRFDGERLEIRRCGGQQSGGGIVVISDGSSVRSSLIAANGGAGVLLGATDGSRPANGNTIDGCTISSNAAGVVLSPGSSRNVITRNDIMWNRLGGVTVAPFETAAPRENRISANRFDENGLRPIVLDMNSGDPNVLRRGSDGCARPEGLASGGISPPRIESVRVANERVVLRGRACPGEIVEVYQSYVTSGVREETRREMPRIRDDEGERESASTTRERVLPSIGEFNYLGAINTAADGTFEASFPFPALIMSDRTRAGLDQGTDIWATEVMPGARPDERAFSGIAIDARGNTSEMSVRRSVD